MAIKKNKSNAMKKNGRDTNKKRKKRSHGIKNVYDYLQSFAIALQLTAS